MRKLTYLGWALLGLSALASLLYGWVLRDWVLEDASALERVLLKTPPVALLALVSFFDRGRFSLTAALALGALGDALLAAGDGMWLIAGGAAFVLGHAFYIWLFLNAGIGFGAALKQQPRPIGMALIVLVTVVSLFLLWPDNAAAGAMTVVYAVVVAAMAITTLTLPRYASLAMLGGALFLVSDIMLSWPWNSGSSDPGAVRLISDMGWFTYYFAQVSLCLGALSLRIRA